jgi:hypothetical protein
MVVRGSKGAVVTMWTFLAAGEEPQAAPPRHGAERGQARQMVEA